MAPRVVAMGLFCLRGASSFSWRPVARLSGPGAGFVYGKLWSDCPKTVGYSSRSAMRRTCNSFSGSSSDNSSRRPTKLSSTSMSSLGSHSSGTRDAEAAAALGTVEKIGHGEEDEMGPREDSSGDESQRPPPQTQEGSVTVTSNAMVQPLLQRYMESSGTDRSRKKKPRQHVNPLAATFQEPVVLPEGWFQSAYRDPSASLMVDIGCAKGSFLMSMAERHQDQNFLGLEIRRPVTAMAFARAAKLETKNCHFVCCNANVDLDTVLSEAARNGASIDTICIQFPDPHFKTKHYKRRVMQPELVTCIETHLRPGGILFMQSDVLEVLEDMRTITRDTAELLEDSRSDIGDWMEGPERNPFAIQTEREVATYRKESANENRVYRCVFVKKGTPE